MLTMDKDKEVEALERIAAALERIATQLEPGPQYRKQLEKQDEAMYQTLWDQVQGMRRKS